MLASLSSLEQAAVMAFAEALKRSDEFVVEGTGNTVVHPSRPLRQTNLFAQCGVSPDRKLQVFPPRSVAFRQF